MKYYSLGNKSHQVTFKQAVLSGIAPDKTLYFPEQIPKADTLLSQTLSSYTLLDLAFTFIQPFIGDEIDEQSLRKILAKTLDFDFPLVEVGPYYSLELFHGPTLAFKDVGARFMAQCLGYFNQKRNQKTLTTVLVATSGDTGGAVANGFLGVPGVEVVVLFPKGKGSEVQELQMTTLGKNIRAVSVDGSFDDCQRFVKQAFVDSDIASIKTLTSANSINVARWLPQMLYYIAAHLELLKSGDTRRLICSVPSGNFGNLCAGMVAQRMGIPIEHFIAATNINDTIYRYLKTAKYEPLETQPTLSNAMDVSDPSNFVRIEELLGKTDLGRALTAYRFDDKETREAIRELYHVYGYIADPHGAIGYLGLKQHGIDVSQYAGVFLETAHPIKFDQAVKETIQRSIPEPAGIDALRMREKHSLHIRTYENLKELLSAS